MVELIKAIKGDLEWEMVKIIFDRVTDIYNNSKLSLL